MVNARGFQYDALPAVAAVVAELTCLVQQPIAIVIQVYSSLSMHSEQDQILLVMA